MKGKTMPRDMIVKVYQFDELSESAKENARDWWRNGMDFAWCDESKDSIRAFCAQFGIELRDWNIGPFYPIDYRLSEYDNSNFRGMKLSQFTRENYPTGYYLDADMSIEFFDVFQKTGDAKYAFECAVEAGFIGWRNDMESQISDEYIDELLVMNEYEFTENGTIA
jgi:hypothetical protein